MFETNPVAMSGILCNVAGCPNTIDMNGDGYCAVHRSNKCTMRGCSNTIEFEGNFLCMVCLQAQKILLRNVKPNVNVECNDQTLYQDNVCITKGCTNSREFEGSDLCIVCSQSKRNSLKNDITKVNKQPNDFSKSSSTHENTGESTWKNQSNSYNDIHISSNDSKDAMNLSSSCTRDIALKGVIKKGIQRKECNMGNYTNSIESTDIRLEDQERRSGDIESTEMKPLMPYNDKDASKPQTDNNGFDFRVMAKNLPPIPSIPTTCDESKNTGRHEIIAVGSVEHKVDAKDNIPMVPIPFDTLPPIPLPLLRSNSFPESRSVQVNELTRFMSQPPHSFHEAPASPSCKVLDCHFLAVNDLSGYCFNCFAANNNFENIPNSFAARGTIPVAKQNTISKLPSCKFIERGKSNLGNLNFVSKDAKYQNDLAREICKVKDCKYFVNEGLGGYCSECFMCCNISDNLPPSPTHQPIGNDFNVMIDRGEEGCIGGASSFENRLCKGENCEFFGSDDFNGYCSQCYVPEVRRKDVDVEYVFNDYDDDNKLCIICIQTPYNTVLLPCGHLYLCFECATSITKKRAKCPACRSHIQSVHRVYTPD